MTFKFISFSYGGQEIMTCDSSGKLKKSRAIPRTADQMTIQFKQNKPPEHVYIQPVYQYPVQSQKVAATVVSEHVAPSELNQLEQSQEDIFSCFFADDLDISFDYTLFE